MACGLPVIATKCGGPEEIVTPSTGLLVSTENVGELTEAITFISRNLLIYDRDVTRNYVNNTFGQRVFLNKISSVYENLLDDHSH
jgi:L-malate glycosyltransferase